MKTTKKLLERLESSENGKTYYSGKRECNAAFALERAKMVMVHAKGGWRTPDRGRSYYEIYGTIERVSS